MTKKEILINNFNEKLEEMGYASVVKICIKFNVTSLIYDNILEINQLVCDEREITMKSLAVDIDGLFENFINNNFNDDLIHIESIENIEKFQNQNSEKFKFDFYKNLYKFELGEYYGIKSVTLTKEYTINIIDLCKKKEDNNDA